MGNLQFTIYDLRAAGQAGARSRETLHAAGPGEIRQDAGFDRLEAGSTQGTVWCRLMVMLLALVLGAVNFSAGAAEAGKTLYTCGMHPQIIQDHPGNCPICGMKLTPIHKDGGADAAASSTAITVDAATAQNMNLRTAIVQAGPLRKTIRTVGTIDYNETALAEVKEPVTAAEMAKRFARARTADVGETLETLCAMGKSRHGKADGTFLP